MRQYKIFVLAQVMPSLPQLLTNPGQLIKKNQSVLHRFNGQNEGVSIEMHRGIRNVS